MYSRALGNPCELFPVELLYFPLFTCYLIPPPPRHPQGVPPRVYFHSSPDTAIPGIT